MRVLGQLNTLLATVCPTKISTIVWLWNLLELTLFSHVQCVTGFKTMIKARDLRTLRPFITSSLVWARPSGVRWSRKDYFAYQFRTPMPIDVSKIDGDMWPSYERCENLSCHAAELRTVTLIFCSNFGPPILSDNKKLSIRSWKNVQLLPNITIGKLGRCHHMSRWWRTFRIDFDNATRFEIRSKNKKARRKSIKR